MIVFLVLLVSVLAVFAIWRIYFLRDPIRVTPEGNNIVSPADGYILYIKEVRQGDVPIAIKNKRSIPLREITDVREFAGTSGQLIGIYMTPWSVHRNRAPVTAEIALKKHFKTGHNLGMVRSFIETLFRVTPFGDSDFYLTNERLTTGFKTHRGSVFVIQIADAWIDQIISWVNIGDGIQKGHQYGMIRFGSQCDVFIPDCFKLKLNVKVGQYAYAGETVLGDLEGA